MVPLLRSIWVAGNRGPVRVCLGGRHTGCSIWVGVDRGLHRRRRHIAWDGGPRGSAGRHSGSDGLDILLLCCLSDSVASDVGSRIGCRKKLKVFLSHAQLTVSCNNVRILGVLVIQS